MELVSQDLVKSLLTMGKSYLEISIELINVYPEIKRGLSERSVRRYVKQHDLKSLCEQDKEQAIQESVQEVVAKCILQIDQDA